MQALGRVLQVLADLREAVPDEAQVAYARWMVARDEACRFDTNRGTGGAVTEVTFSGQPLEAWDGLRDALLQVDGDRVFEAAQGCALGREGIAALGDAKVVEPLLRAAGLEPELLPAVQPAE